MPANGHEINPFFAVKIAVDICRQFAKFVTFVMKSETTNTVLTFVLAVLVLAGVLFALQTIFRSRELRNLQAQTIACQSNLNRLNLLLNEAIVYGKVHPEINHVIQPFEAKPATR
jgi:hypothetical protein